MTNKVKKHVASSLILLSLILLLVFNNYLPANIISTAVKKASTLIMKKLRKGKAIAGRIKQNGKVNGKLISRVKNIKRFVSNPLRINPLMRHPKLSEILIKNHGNKAFGVLNTLSRKNSQRLSIMAANGNLKQIGRTKEIFALVEKRGNKAMDFIWRNKKSLLVGTVLATFIKDPSSYFNGAKTLIVEPVIEPIIKGVNWNLIISLIFFLLFVLFGLKRFYNNRNTRSNHSKLIK